MSTTIHRIPASTSPASPVRLSTSTRLLAADDHTLTGVRGLTWLTLDNDLRDIVLGSGQRFTVPANCMAVVGSLVAGAPFEAVFAAAPAGSSNGVTPPTALANRSTPASATARGKNSPRTMPAWRRLWQPLVAALSAHGHSGVSA